MLWIVHRAVLGFGVALVVSATVLPAQEPAAPAAPALSPKERYIADELSFADKLNNELRFPDYALKVLDALIAKHPDAKDSAKMIRIASLAMQGKFEAAETELATLPANSPELVAGTLALGDVYYAIGNLAKAREIYEGFLNKYPDGPPAEIKEFYLRSADRYIQMLTLKGDDAGALKVSRMFIKAEPEPDVMRSCKMHMAELCLRAARAGQDRDALLKEGQELCEDLMWAGQDLIFARCVVILAHIYLEKGERDEAKSIIEDNLTMLRTVDKEMQEQRVSSALSPMAECRFLLGMLLEEDGRKAMDAGDEKKGVALLKQALEQLYTVCAKYGQSRWAPDAAKHADELVAYLKSKGREVAVPNINLNTVADAQVEEARSLLASKDWAAAKQAYLQILSQFPTVSDRPAPIAALTQACIEDKDLLYASVFRQHPAERYHQTPAMEHDAGLMLLGIASTYRSSGQTNESLATMTLVVDHYPTHQRTPLVLFTLGDTYRNQKDFAKAEGFYRRIVEDYPRAPSYGQALSSLASCQMALKKYASAVDLLTRYAEKLKPGPDKAEALLRLANAQLESGKTVAALKQFLAIQALLKPKKDNPYSLAEDASKRNAKTLQKAIFWSGHCYSIITKPEDKVPAYRQKAVEAYETLLKDPTIKELGPPTLAALGTLYFLQDKPELADKTFHRLATEYPDAPQAKNALFTQGRSLLKIGQAKRAIDVFQRMFDAPATYKPGQFYQVGKLMSEAGQHETAAKAYAQAQNGSDETTWSAATVGLGKSFVELGRNDEALAAANSLLNKNPKGPYSVAAYQIQAHAYGNMMRAETGDEKTRFGHYEKAIGALAEVRKRTKNPVILATAELELADIQIALGEKSEAIATLYRIIDFADIKKKELHPSLESAYHRLMPLLLEASKYEDAVDVAKQYLAQFPSGSYIRDIRSWRDEAAAKVAP